MRKFLRYSFYEDYLPLHFRSIKVCCYNGKPRPQSYRLNKKEVHNLSDKKSHTHLINRPAPLCVIDLHVFA